MATCKVTYNVPGRRPDKDALRKVFGDMRRKQPGWLLQMLDGGPTGVTFKTDIAGVSSKDLCDFVIPYFKYDDYTVSPQG